MSTCPQCGAAWPDFISPKGSTGVLCLECGYIHPEIPTDRHRPDEEPEP